ncbi:phage minor head protein [Shinella sp.]|uniref:phage head morphogenesis protein n=1 Tax=Shinella sp. TaxID=1870904 RepID=UPI00259036EE|nr:phage minor head protein [Shinella sp.]MCW5708682.1 hypothetical protein [Shinella sp.]
MAFLEGKGFTTSFHWQDTWAEEHAHAFTVAKAMEMDVLQAIRDDVNRAMRDGIPFEQFRQELTPRLVALGWWGKKPMVDPLTGEEKIVQLGSPRRLQTIYWANTRSAYAAGHWERAQRTKRGLPYFVYELGPSEQHRPHHEAIANRPTVLPVDDPFWDTHYPPNGWGCKCRLRQITQFEADEIGAPEGAPEVTLKEFRNKRTGEISMIPEGVDPGWHTNPGKARAKTLMQGFESRLKEAPEPVARKAIADFWESRAPEAYRRMAEAVDLPVAVAPRLAAELDAASPIVAVSSHAIGDGDLAPYGEVQRMIDEGAETKQPGGLRRFWHRLSGRSWTASIGRAANGLLRLVGLSETDETRPK